MKGFDKLEWLTIDCAVGDYEGCWLLIPTQHEIIYTLIDGAVDAHLEDMKRQAKLYDKFKLPDDHEAHLRVHGKIATMRVSL